MPENTIEVYNLTSPANNQLRCALYQKQGSPNQDVVAWKIVNPVTQGYASISVPEEYVIQFTYEDDGVTYFSDRVTINSHSADLAASAIVDDASGQKTYILTKIAAGNDASTPGHILVSCEPTLGRYLTFHVFKEGSDIVPPIDVSPGLTGDFEVVPTFYMAIIYNGTPQGALLKSGALSSSETAVRPGQKVQIVGNKNTGYTFSVN